jgi:MarR-like DNA-binding transcriptional regulator SgrR of sgrS sRNA
MALIILLLNLAVLKVGANFFGISLAQAKELKMATEGKIVRTYMSLPKEVDPAHILTMADLDLSYALASTLVEWDDSRQPVGALSEKWDFPKPNVIRFHLRDAIQWSNGDKILAREVCASFERAKKKYLDELQSLFDVVSGIRCPNDNTVEFETKTTVAESNILRKITEPMYGLVDVRDDGNLSLKRSSGPFLVQKVSPTELVLVKNKHWYKDSAAIAEKIELRPAPVDTNVVAQFVKDPWANMISANSLQPKAVVDEFKTKGFDIWQRSYDKIFYLAPSKTFLKEFGSRPLKALGRQIHVEDIMPGLSGFTPTEQFFPRGYVLHSLNFKTEPEKSVPDFKRPLRILMPATPSGLAVRESLPKEIERLTGKKPELILVKPNEIGEAKGKEVYDILACNLAVDDPNFEGAMAFFFAGNSPLIPSGMGENNFVEKIANAKFLKTDAERIEAMRSVISKATQEGYVVPLFHFASLTVGKNGIDLSRVPLTKETIPFSQIRFK